MKADDGKFILSIRYTFLDSPKGKTTHIEEMEHFFLASDKQNLLTKIRAFESELKLKKKPSTLARIKAYLKHFLESWRYTQRSMLRI